MSYRPERVAREIQRLLSQPIQDIAPQHGGGLITLTDVKVSPDLTIAKLYVSVYGNSLGGERIISLLNERAHEFRSIIAQLRLKVIPQIRFYLDSTLDSIARIEQLLRNSQRTESNKSE
ncbi:MAG: 30S ribosome-binding factor RbfA [Bacteroidota bacterium]|nr:30S ribosome-binding factor RbfA [Candidatus Kapabacteria bacterium]MCS7302991.1 30S ribosome-binding factor RbfA [Candidatus Kapabacteria bacterium]MCX7937378.1 30S ribosome-binding factor RbfA [Chlorobiota bacterium]MDW8074499.1 30S ribosome-binding factor RbfA [Bacteroidota bacterium]MDW8271025.1 30S ribosome-binding factor RbfA [Bacteroidota bacterium]